MTDISEADFQALVYEWLVGNYGTDNVRHEPHLYTDRRPDFLVYDDRLDVTWAIEAENDVDDVPGGVGQAELYGAHYDGWQPAVIFPKTLPADVEEEIDLLRDRIHIVRKDPDDLRN